MEKNQVSSDRYLIPVIFIVSVVIGCIGFLSTLFENGFDWKNIISALIIGGVLFIFCFLGLASSFMPKLQEPQL